MQASSAEPLVEIGGDSEMEGQFLAACWQRAVSMLLHASMPTGPWPLQAQTSRPARATATVVTGRTMSPGAYYGGDAAAKLARASPRKPACGWLSACSPR